MMQCWITVHKKKIWKNPNLNKKSLCLSLTWPTYICGSSTVSPHVSSNGFLCLSRPLTHSFCSSLISVSISHDSRLTTRLRKCACHGPNLFKDTKSLCRLFLTIDQKRYFTAGVYMSEALSLLGFCLGCSSNFVGSESFHIHSVYLLYMLHTTRSTSPPRYTLYEYCTYCTPVLVHTGKGGRGIGEPVRRLDGRYFKRGVENTIMTGCISSL
jgi:hypothetical protein